MIAALGRRRFLSLVAGAAGAAAGRPGARTAVAPGLQDLAPSPLTPEVERFRDALAAASPLSRKGPARDEYLRVAEGIVRFFARHQSASGAIVDPYEQAEKQYSTPAFALTTAVLAANDPGRPSDGESGTGPTRPASELREAGLAAMDRACADLPAGRAADRHADFYISLLMQALDVLQPRTPKPRVEGWLAHLRAIAPEKVYRFQPGGDRPANNWNLVASYGEFRRYQAGLSSDLAWVERSLAEQVQHLTEHGLYRDPNDPLPYDHFARFHLNLLLESGYRGPQAERLRELMARAAWASLFMVSPHGEAPCGGRSAHHQWNEAQQALTFEQYAARFARFGDRASAGAFRRAARLSLASVARWVRPSGELWIVKNRVDPSRRHGYEPYSFHSQYNLLCAAKLVAAYLRADDTILEAPIPSELGGYVFALQPAFHKVFASAAGTLVEIDTGADLKYNPTGILRVHVAGISAQLGLTDGLVPAPTYQVPNRAPRAIALGPAWRDAAGEWHTLASHGREDLEPVSLAIATRSLSRVEFLLRYAGRFRGGATAIEQRITVTGRGVEITDTIHGDIRGIRAECPVLLNDGERSTTVSMAESSVTVRGLDSAPWEVASPTGRARRLEVTGDGRNGTYGMVVFEGSGRSVSYRAGLT